jgi:hypothetical protein
MKEQHTMGSTERAALLLIQALLCIFAAFATTMIMVHGLGFLSGTDCDCSMVFLYAAIANLTFFHTLELQNRQASAWKTLLITGAVSPGISLLIVLAFSLFHSRL